MTGQTAVTYGYDDANRLTSVTQGANAVSFEYDVASRRTKATLPNLVTIDYAYNNGNELTTLTYKRNTTTTLGTLGYTYDAAGRRLTMTGSLARVALPPALSSATYDAANTGGCNLYGYVEKSPVAFGDPSGLFGGDWHPIITRAAFASFPCFSKDVVDAVARDTQNADWNPGAQHPSRSHEHGMRDGKSGATPADATESFTAYVASGVDSGTRAGLAGAMHAAQDGFARGHEGFQPWNGGKWSGFAHLFFDLFPSKREFNAAVSVTRGTIAAWIAKHGCTCPR